MRIGGSIEGIRLHHGHEDHGDRGRSHVERKDGRKGIVRHVATEHGGRVREKSTDAEVRPAALRSDVEIERRGQGANRAVRKQLKGIVHAVRDELKQLVRQSASDETAAGKVDGDLHHALKRLNHGFRHAVRGAYREASANGAIDGEQLLAAVRSEFEGLLERVSGALSPAVIDATETPETGGDVALASAVDGIAESPEEPESGAGLPERLQAIAGRIEELLGQLQLLLQGPAPAEVANAPAPTGGTAGFGFTFELALTLYTDSGLSSDARVPGSDVDSVV